MSKDIKEIKIVKLLPGGFTPVTPDQTTTDDDSAKTVESYISETDDEDIVHKEKPVDLVHLNTPANVTVTKEINNEQAGGKGETIGVDNYLQMKKDDDDVSTSSKYSEKDVNVDGDELKVTEEFDEKSDIITPESPEFTTMVSRPTVIPQKKEEPKERNDYYSDEEEDIIDMTDNKLYEVLAMVLEDGEGDNVSENLLKINNNLEKHNEILTKLVQEYAEINRERNKERRHFEQMAMAINNQNLLLMKLLDVFENGNSDRKNNRKEDGNDLLEKYSSRMFSKGGSDGKKSRPEPKKEEEANLKTIRMTNRL